MVRGNATAQARLIEATVASAAQGLGSWNAATFSLIDGVRRQAGCWCDAMGIGKHETPFIIAAEMNGARLRLYRAEAATTGPTLLIVPAPFKRPYIWDLHPDRSVVRRCLAGGLRVYLLDWALPGPDEDHLGLADYAHRLVGEALDAMEAQTGEAASILAGNSLGGTLAAIFASLTPERVLGLALIDAPLAFGKGGGPLARLAKVAPDARLLRQMLGSPVRGSAIDLLSVSSLPEVFLWQRHWDFLASLADPSALDLHLRVMRWTLDESPMAGKLFDDVLEQLYKRDRFVRGTLTIAGRVAAARNIRAPVFAVLNPDGRVVPPTSIEAALHLALGIRLSLHMHEGQVGTALQHMGPLVDRRAHERLWPAFLDWALVISRQSIRPE